MLCRLPKKVDNKRTVSTDSSSSQSLSQSQSLAPLHAALIVLVQHTTAVNKVLEDLITHSLAGQMVLNELRNAASDEPDEASSSDNDKLANDIAQAVDPTVSVSDTIDKIKSQEEEDDTSGYPVLIHSHTGCVDAATAKPSGNSLRVRVFGWTDVVTTTNTSIASRLFSNPVTMVVHFDIEVVYNGLIWICRKRYCQFRALLFGKKMGDVLQLYAIVCSMTYSVAYSV